MANYLGYGIFYYYLRCSRLNDLIKSDRKENYCTIDTTWRIKFYAVYNIMQITRIKSSISCLLLYTYKKEKLSHWHTTYLLPTNKTAEPWKFLQLWQLENIKLDKLSKLTVFCKNSMYKVLNYSYIDKCVSLNWKNTEKTGGVFWLED